MKDKLKKQKRNITIKITSIFVAVWLIVSVVFSIAVISMEKTEIINEEQEKFRILVSSIESNGRSLVDLYTNNLKEPYAYSEGEKPERSCGADSYLDDSMQVVVLSKNEDGTYSEIIDTDKSVSTHDYTVVKGENIKSLVGGKIYYDRFIESLTQEQLNSISKYLYTKKDKDGNYYELICKEFYLDDEDEKSDEIIPKTVEIVKTDENNTWYAQDEVIETYELNPKFTDKLTLYTSSDDDRNVIPGQFVLGTFQSGGLIDSRTDDDSYTFLDMSCTKISPFTYVYKNGANAFTTITTTEEVVFEPSDSDGVYYEVYQSLEPELVINYAKRFNVLDSCKDALILGIAVLFLFFLIIGVILTIMMCKVMKTQVIAEQKRREVTNALAHDIKTPLFIISGYAQSLKENINTDKREHYCDRIIERTEEVNNLVHTMLDFSKLDSAEQKLNFDNVDITELVNDTVRKFDGCNNNKNIVVSIDDNPTVFADKELIKRALSNLIDNAVRYSDDNTEIRIDISKNSFSISNICSTITQEDIKHLFEPYYKVEKNRESKGNGLGLSIVKSILDIHGYKFDVKLSNQIITFSVLF